MRHEVFVESADSQTPTGAPVGKTDTTHWLLTAASAVVHGLRARAARVCMPPRIRLGICRADGYTDPSGSRWLQNCNSGEWRPVHRYCPSGLRSPSHRPRFAGIARHFSLKAIVHLRRGSVPEVGPCGQPSLGYARTAARGAVGAVVCRTLTGRSVQRQRRQEPSMGPWRGHRYHRQDVSSALRVTVDRSQFASCQLSFASAHRPLDKRGMPEMRGPRKPRHRSFRAAPHSSNTAQEMGPRPR